MDYINSLRKEGVEIIPSKGTPLFFKAFKITPYSKVKVVVLGQDPYHNPVEAYDGLAFSNSTIQNPQPSLVNILDEVEKDVYNGLWLNKDASLYPWAEQGVLLINTAHTVEKNKPASHLTLWLDFTKFVVKELNKKNNVIWLLWGRQAQNYGVLITNPTHYILKSSHPSPLGYDKTDMPFKGCKHFSKVNEQLGIRNIKQINW
jgi:uracil-DNA glycosylase